MDFFFQFLATNQGAYIIEGNSDLRLPFSLATCIMIHALEWFVNNFFKKGLSFSSSFIHELLHHQTETKKHRFRGADASNGGGTET